MPRKAKIPSKQNLISKMKVSSKITSPVKKSKGSVFNTKKIKIKFSKVPFIIFLSFVVVALVGYFLKNWLIVASVNGQPITRISFYKELDNQHGIEALESLINKKLIEQESQKQNLTVSTQQINEEISTLEQDLQKQGNDLNQLLAERNWTREDLSEQIRIQKLFELTLGDKISVTDQEVEEYLKTNKDLITEDANKESLHEEVKNSLKQQRLAEQYRPWLEEKRNNANIRYFNKL